MRYVIVLFALAGIVVSTLALEVHYSTGAQPCDINSHWDCGIVNHSSYATVQGVFFHWRKALRPASVTGPAPRTGFPIAGLGILGYTAIVFFAFFRKRWITLLLATGALAFALYLSSVEAHVLEVWCLYCVISQTIIAVIFLLTLVTLFMRPRSS